MLFDLKLLGYSCITLQIKLDQMIRQNG